MEIQAGEALSADQAMAMLFEKLPEVRRWSTVKIATMKMPPAHSAGAPCAGMPAPSLAAIRQSLLHDEDLLGAIELEVIVSFRKRVDRGPISCGEVAPYLYRTTEFVADRRARRAAKRYLRELVPGSGAAEPPSTELPEALLESRELQARLGAILMRMTPAELVILEASVTQRYDAAAAELGIARQTARNRACLLRQRIRAELLD